MPSCHWSSAGGDASSFFPRLLGAPSQTEASTDLVQIAETDLDAEPLLEGRLHHTTGSAGRRVTVGFQPDALVRSQFGRVPMSAILECSFPTAPYLARASDRPSND